MANSTPIVRQLVLRSIVDLFESFEWIFEQVSGWATERGMRLTRSEVAEAIEWAIGEGLAQAYLLSEWPPHSQLAQFSAERLDELWYYVTPQGLQRFKELEDQYGE